MFNMYQTEATETQIDWKYTGVRARTPAYELVRRALFLHFLIW